MNFEIDFHPKAQKEFNQLDRVIQVRVMRYLLERASIDPKAHGKALVGDKKGMWRYRVGDFRIITDIQNDKLIILVLKVAKRSDVYD